MCAIFRNMEPTDRTSAPEPKLAAWQRAVAEHQARYRVDELIGMTVAEARAVVKGAGGEFATDQGPITTKFDLRRVVATVADGRVVSAHVG